MTDKLCIRCYISGRVQGVWFRDSTKEQAKQLNISGWAKNLPDGRVEIVASGERANLDELYEWLQDGPKLANVTDCTREELSWYDYMDFEIK